MFNNLLSNCLLSLTLLVGWQEGHPACKRSIATSVLSHFGPYPLRSFVWGPNWQRTEVTKDRSGCPDRSKDRSGDRSY